MLSSIVNVKLLIKFLTLLSLILVMALVSFNVGFYIAYYKKPPFKVVESFNVFLRNGFFTEFDNAGRLIYKSSAEVVDCPPQDNSTGVILALGQSNAANHSEYLYKSGELKNIYNYFDGKCYLASSPLLGATGADGEWISRTAAKLIENGTYRKVIISSNGVTGSSIKRWSSLDSLLNSLVGTIAEISRYYNVTDVVFHQGEADSRYMSSDTYKMHFIVIKDMLQKSGVDSPIFISIASVCFKGVSPQNEVSKAQMELAGTNGIYLGVNTDAIVDRNMRYDGCHFNRAGQEFASTALAKNITGFHSRSK